MILLTVGSTYPFDRLVRTMDELVASGCVADEVRAQIGAGRYEPKAMSFDRFLDKPEFDLLLARSDCIVSHAGIGSITTALQYGKPLLVVPRLRRFGEIVNDHQLATARQYERLGHVLAAYESDQIAQQINRLKSFRPEPRSVNAVGVATRVADFLQTLKVAKARHCEL